MSKSLLLALGLLVSTASLAQTTPSPVPAGYTFQAQPDHDRYVPQVLATINWLETSTLPTDDAQRRAANQFLIQWISGTSTVSVQLQEYVTDLSNKDGDLLMAFMGGWTRYALQNAGTKDQLLLNTAGVKDMLTTYQAKGGKGSKKLNDLAALDAKGQLPTWIKAHVK